MGFFDFVKKVGCGVGLHDWTDWKYTGDKTCEQTRSCIRDGCFKVATQINHSWSGWFYVNHDNCLQNKLCSRCGNMDRRTEHDWDVWVYESPTSCNQVTRCRHCNAAESKTAVTLLDHQLAPTDLPRVSCTLRMGPCKRCGKPVMYPMELAPEHRWGSWEKRVGNRTVRKCHDCGATQEGTTS